MIPSLLPIVEAHVYEIDQTTSRLCTCGWPTTRRGIETDLQTAQRAHLAAEMDAEVSRAITETRARLQRAVGRLEERRDAPSVRRYGDERVRLGGKVEGVKLALSYIEEERRAGR